MMPTSSRTPWVIVSGDLTTWGGMDRANYELAAYLAEEGLSVHIVAHFVAEPLAQHPSVTWHKALDSRDAVVVLQPNRKNHPDLPNVPQAIKFAKGEEGRKMIEVGIHGDSDIVRTYTLPPGTPKDRVQLLRRAFDATLKDPEFVADAKKSRLNVDPIPAEEIEKDISGLFKLDPGLVAKLKDVLYN